MISCNECVHKNTYKHAEPCDECRDNGALDGYFKKAESEALTAEEVKTVKVKEFIVELKIKISGLVYSRSAEHETGKIIAACSSENWVKIELQNGYYWKGSSQEFIERWKLTDVPF